MRVLVASNNELAGSELRDFILRSNYASDAQLLSPQKAVEQLAAYRPFAVVLVSPDAADEAVSFAREVRDTWPTPTLVVGPALDAKVLLRLLREGLYEYIDEDEVSIELGPALARLRISAPTVAHAGKVTAMFGAGGGTGATTLAVNLGVSLSTRNNPCVLLELGQRCSDAACLLDLCPENSLGDFCRLISKMDRTLFERCLIRHSSGLSLLASPQNAVENLLITPQAVRKALSYARGMFSHVLVELDGILQDNDLQALRHADQILLVVRLDYTSVQNARRLLGALRQLGIDRSCIRLIVNRYRRPKELSLLGVEKSLGMKASLLVPDDVANVTWNNNRGLPVVLGNRRSAFSQSVRKLADVVSEGTVAAEPSGFYRLIREMITHVLVF